MKPSLTHAVPLLALLTSCGIDSSEAPNQASNEEQTQTQAVQGTGCTVTPQEEFITDLSVVEDPIRTTWVHDPATDPKAAAWTFGRLMTEMAGTNDPSDFVKSLFTKWEADHTVNSFVVPARPNIDQTVLNPWPKLANGKLDLTKAPLRLLAIVNRFDLRKLSQGNAGEARFVFGVLDANGNPLQFTVILEYKMLATTQADALAWANAWHGLGALKFPSANYNKALQVITDKFAGANVAPSRPNGSAISQIRANEIALSAPWQLREFHLNAQGNLVEATVANNPDASFNNTATLATFINQNQAGLIAQTKQIPLSFDGAPFRGGAILNNIDFWNAPGINDNEARFGLSVNTCNGCHGAETNTFFLQVNPRSAGFASQLSGFLTGEVVNDPVVLSTQRTFNDIARRQADLATIVCGTGPAVFDVPTERVH